MTQERLMEIMQMLKAWKATDAHAGDAEKTDVVGELLAELTCPTASKSTTKESSDGGSHHLRNSKR